MEKENLRQEELSSIGVNESGGRKKMWISGAVVVFFLIFLGIFYLWFGNAGAEVDTVTLDMEREAVVDEKFATPTPMPFSELTVPYLRSRTFESELGELQRINSNPAYTSHLTNYISDGLQVNGLITIPEGDAPEGGWPAIVFVHGYIPPGTYQTTSGYEDYVDYLARQGFVVFKIDLRGHDESEGEPGGAYYSSDYVVDTLNARAALASSNFVNGDRIGVWGHSMAGNVTFRSFVAQDIPAVVIWAGAVYTYSDMQELGISDNSYRRPDSDSERRRERSLLSETHGEFSAESEFWQQVVPTNYLEGVRGAVQLNHAINDDVVSVEYSRNLATILENANVVHELHQYSSGGHNINGSAFGEAMQETVEFYQEHL